MRIRELLAALVLLASFASCEGNVSSGPSYVFADPELKSLSPGVLLPGTRIVLQGKAFVPADVGQSALRLAGTFNGREVSDLVLPATFLDYDRMEAQLTAEVAGRLPEADGTFIATAELEVKNSADLLTHTSAKLFITLEIRSTLDPRLDVVQEGVVFINNLIAVEGEGFLLGGDEGQTSAVVQGCYQRSGSTTCVAVGPTEVTAQPDPDLPFSRQRAYSRSARGSPGSSPAPSSGRSGCATGSVTAGTRATPWTARLPTTCSRPP